MKYEESWRRVTLSASNYYAHIFHRGMGKPKARNERTVLKNKTWIRYEI
jgi:hypothetical protein